MYLSTSHSQLERRWMDIDAQIRRHEDDIKVVDKDHWQSAVASLHSKSDAIANAFDQIRMGHGQSWEEAEAHLTMAVDDLELNYRIAKGELTAANATTDKDFRASLNPDNVPSPDDQMHSEEDPGSRSL